MVLLVLLLLLLLSWFIYIYIVVDNHRSSRRLNPANTCCGYHWGTWDNNKPQGGCGNEVPICSSSAHGFHPEKTLQVRTMYVWPCNEFGLKLAGSTESKDFAGFCLDNSKLPLFEYFLVIWQYLTMAKFRSWPRRNLLQPGLGGSIVPWYRNDVPLPVKMGLSPYWII